MREPLAGEFYRLQTAIDSWQEWGQGLTQRPQLVGPIIGGRTNRSFLLRAVELDHDLLLRINNPQSTQLGINREHEMHIVQTVADAGLTRPACYWEPQHRFTVFHHVDARNWTAQDFADSQQRRRLLECLEQVRDLPLNIRPRRYYDYINHYWQQLEQRGGLNTRLRREWPAFAADLEAFDEAGWPVQLTHHDLIPENILEHEGQLLLIDWEYAALGHADIDRWCLDAKLVQEPFVHELALWTNRLWERIVALTP